MDDRPSQTLFEYTGMPYTMILGRFYDF